jgi:hypothetical protein
MTDMGPRRIEELFEEAGEEVIHGEGQIRFPRELYTYTYNGEGRGGNQVGRWSR